MLISIFASYQLQSVRFQQVANQLQDLAIVEFEIRGEPRQFLARFASDQEQISYSAAIKLTKIELKDRTVLVKAPATATFRQPEFEFYRGQKLRATVKFAQPWAKQRSCCRLELITSAELVNDANLAYRFAAAIRAGLHQSLIHSPENGAALVPGLVLGDTAQQTVGLETAMRGSGLAHLTAVSGGNVTIVLGLFVVVFTILGFGNRALVLISIIALAGYVLAVGFDASVMRAAAMGSITLWAFINQQKITSGKILLWATFILTVFNPWLAVNWGFLLSVSATAALIWFSPQIMRAMPWPHPYSLLAAALAATMAASWVTAPLLAIMTSSVPVVSVLANLLAAPLVAITTILGLLAALVALVDPKLAIPLSWLSSWPAELIGQIALQTAALPGAQLELSKVGTGWLIVLVVLIILLISFSKYRKHLLALLLLMVFCFPLLVSFYRAVDGWPPNEAIVLACDVGQGTAIIVPVAKSTAILLDTGPEPAAIDKCLARAGIKRLVAVFISHFHADHAAGLAGAIARRQVDSIWVSPNFSPIHQFRNVEQLAKRQSIPLNPTRSGAKFKFGDVEIKVIWPSSNQLPTNENDSSLILLVSSKNTTFLFTGDIEPAGQRELMQNHKVRADIALVPHHGSKYQDPKFAAWTAAKLAIVTVGPNYFGHPATETLANWQQHANVLRTDLIGDFAVMGSTDRLVVVKR